MPLRVADGWTTLQPIGSWVLPGEPDFAETRAYELLVRDLERYVLEEVAGRSFLIAGHRGAGKTSTVVQAIRKLRRRMLQDSVNVDAPPIGRRGRMQRPLLVKLVGHSLIAELPRKEAAEAAAAAAQSRIAQQAQAAAARGQTGTATPAPPPPPPPPPPPASTAAAPAQPHESQVENALVHITIALYRALAQEVSEGFAVHAGTGAPQWRAERLEMAKQLALDLDGGPDPGTLRRYWSAIGRLDRGVLWPPRTDQTFLDKFIFDQGMREIVAVATAAQAFQVCSGNVTYSVKSVETADREEKSEYRLDVKDLLNRVTTIGAGTLAGGAVGAGSGAAEGIGAGLLVWLTSTLVLNISGSRTRKSERSADYQFLSDRSIQTLDRDLPLVMDRIRDAGLAPVFVIDELDKLGRPDLTIKQIINRLKHLVSDYGFFCFLTDRGYFEQIEQKLRDEPYPTEHTYFSQRVLVVNQSADLFDYLVGLVGPEPASHDGSKLPIAVFALAVIFRSRLNFSDVARKVADLVNPDDFLTCGEDELQLPGQYRLAATIQLAIDEVLRGEKVAKKVAAEPAFAQLAVDALYYIPRQWETVPKNAVDIRRTALKTYLEKRLRERTVVVSPASGAAEAPASQAAQSGVEEAGATGQAAAVQGAAQAQGAPPAQGAAAAQAASPAQDAPPAQAAAPAEGAPAAEGAPPAPQNRAGGDQDSDREPSIPDDDLDLLEEMTKQLADSLCDFAALAATIHTRGADEWRRDEIVLTERTGLLGREEDGLYRFCLDEFSYDIDEGARVTDLDQGRRDALAIQIERFDAIRALLAATGLSLGDLARNRIVPATIQDSLLASSQTSAELGLETGKRTSAVRQAEDFGRAVKDAFGARDAAARQALVLLAHARHDGAGSGSPSQTLDSIARHFVREGSSIAKPAGADWLESDPRLDGSPAAILAFSEWYWDTAKPTSTPLAIDADARAALWSAWRGHVLGLLERGQARIPAADYRDLLLAARGEQPGALFRADLSEMTIVDWSRLVLAGLNPPDGSEPAPRWTLFAGLTALRFDQGLLSELDSVDPSQPIREPAGGEEETIIKRIVVRAVTSEPGLLVVYNEESGELPDTPSAGDPPILAVGRNVYLRYREGLEWLANQGAFSGRNDEI